LRFAWYIVSTLTPKKAASCCVVIFFVFFTVDYPFND